MTGVKLARKVGCSIFLLASAAMAQALLPGTLASSTTFTAAAVSSSDAQRPITAQQRIQWVVKTTVGPEGIAGEVVGAGWGTLFNRPKAYGTHWQGFGDRLGMSVAGNSMSNTMEAGLGAIWGEDPRYFREGPAAAFGHRLGHAAKMTLMAQNRDGDADARLCPLHRDSWK